MGKYQKQTSHLVLWTLTYRYSLKIQLSYFQTNLAENSNLPPCKSQASKSPQTLASIPTNPHLSSTTHHCPLAVDPLLATAGPSPSVHARLFLLSWFTMSLSLLPLLICNLSAAGNDLWLGPMRCLWRPRSEVRVRMGGWCLSPFGFRTGSHGHYKSFNIVFPCCQLQRLSPWYSSFPFYYFLEFPIA